MIIFLLKNYLDIHWQKWVLCQCPKRRLNLTCKLRLREKRESKRGRRIAAAAARPPHSVPPLKQPCPTWTC